MPKDRRGGFPTHWTVREGARAALLIHCSLAHKGAWSGVAERLDPSLRMTAFDLPGHGRSGDWDGRGDYQAVSVAMARDLIDGQADLIGHSFGATVALRLAVERPELVRSLTMIEPVFFAVLSGEASSVVAEHYASYAVITDALECGRAEDAARSFMADWGVGIPWSEIAETKRNYAVQRIGQIRDIEPEIYHDRAGLISRLGGLDLPVMIVNGTQSPAVMSVICDRLAARIPGAVRRHIDGAGHMVPITHPGPVADCIARFLGLKPSRE